LILASDGVMDAVSVKNEFYDVQRFMDSIRSNSGRETSECLKNMLLNLRQFVGNGEFSDDVTLIALRRKR
jgi:serine phosphatase RsbU (regulator of sigma subunit)